MPYIWTENELFLEHQGLKIYHVYKDDEIEQGVRVYHYTTDPNGCEGGDGAFDVRDLASWSRQGEHHYRYGSDEELALIRRAIVDAIERGELAGVEAAA